MYDIANFFDGNVNVTRLDARLNPTTLPYYNFYVSTWMCDITDISKFQVAT